MGIDIDTFQPLPSVANRGAYGGYSGRGIKPIALRAVSATAAATGLPVSATGGIATWQDAAEFLLAGASTFQICTEVMTRGVTIIDDLIDGLTAYLESKGFESLDAACGKALPHIGDFGVLDATCARAGGGRPRRVRLLRKLRGRVHRRRIPGDLHERLPPPT